MDNDELYQGLTEPSEGDYILSPAGQLGARTAVSVVGTGHVTEFGHRINPPEDAETVALAAIRVRMDREQFWPNVWRADDHGGYTLLTLE